MQIKLSRDKMLAEKLAVDNEFILNYMPFAPEIYVKVYLMGLWAASFDGGGDDAAKFIA